MFGPSRLADQADQAAKRVVGWVLHRVRTGSRRGISWMLRLTAAAMVAYVIAHWLLAGRFSAAWLPSDARPLLAPLTALLVVQVTLVQTIGDTVRRILSVIAGVAVAVVFSSRYGASAITLGVLIGASILIGQILRLGSQLLEVPISAMLVLGVNPDTAASSRVVETIIGAAAGLAANLVFPPAVPIPDAGAALERYADESAALLDRVADGLDRPLVREQAELWLQEARRLSTSSGGIDELLSYAEQSRRLNPRAVGRLDTTPALRSGLDALENAAVVLRSLYRSVAEMASSQAARDDPDAQELRGVFAELMRDLAVTLRAYGALVRAEAAVPDAGGAASEGLSADELAAAVEAAGETRARLTELLLIDPSEQPHLWRQHGGLLTAVERVLQELDADQRLQLYQRQMRAALETQTRAARAVGRLREASRQVSELPHRRQH